MKNTTKKQRLGALDVVIIVAVLVCVVSVGIRMFETKNSELDQNVPLDKYIVSFKVKGIRDSSSRYYITEGTDFYFDDDDSFFGTLRGNSIVNEAKSYYEMPDGTMKIVTNQLSGDLYRVDVEAQVDVTGKMDSNGYFLLGGNKYLGRGKEFKIYSKYLAITVQITDIVKA